MNSPPADSPGTIQAFNARSMNDASALGVKEVDSGKIHDSHFGPKVA